MSTRLLALLSALALMLTACQGAEDPAEEPPEQTPADTQPATPDAPDEPDDGDEPGEDQAWQSCTNPVAGYTVSYPGDWVTNEGDELMDDCRVFDPGPLDLPDAPQDLSLDYGATLSVEPVGFDTVTGGDAGASLESSEDTEVAGRPAVREELVGTGETLIPEGTAFTRYAVDLGGGETFLAHTYDVGDLAYEEKVAVLDEMMTTLEFDDAS